MNDKHVFSELDADLVARMNERGDAGKVSKLGAVAASAPLALGVMASTAFGQALPQQIVDVLNFALTLEFLEDEFYKAGLKAKNLIPKSTEAVFKSIGKNESAHVKLLQTVLGAQATKKPNVDFTAGGMFADVFTNYQTFLALSQAFEDTGVRAYKGQAGNLMSNGAILQTALQIHSVEARHASQVRRIRGEKGWISLDSRGSLPAATQAIYDGENNVTQGGVNLAERGGVSGTAVTEAFDEPLTREDVLAIVRPFLRA